MCSSDLVLVEGLAERGHDAGAVGRVGHHHQGALHVAGKGEAAPAGTGLEGEVEEADEGVVWCGGHCYAKGEPGLGAEAGQEVLAWCIGFLGLNREGSTYNLWNDMFVAGSVNAAVAPLLSPLIPSSVGLAIMVRGKRQMEDRRSADGASAMVMALTFERSMVRILRSVAKDGW